MPCCSARSMAYGLGVHLIHVDQVLLLLGLEDLPGLPNLHPAQLGLLGQYIAQHVVHVHVHAGDLGLGRALLHLDLHQLVLQLALAQAFADVALAHGQRALLLGAGLRLAGLVAQQYVDGVGGLALGGLGQQLHQLVLHVGLGADAHPLGVLALDQADGGLHQVADDALHVAAHVAHLGELGGLHLHKGRVHQLGQAAGDLGLAHAGGADHQYVLRRDLLPDVLRQLGTAIAVAQGHGHGALGVVLADDVAIQFANDLAGG